jgi:hypothetical protein
MLGSEAERRSFDEGKKEEAFSVSGREITGLVLPPALGLEWPSIPVILNHHIEHGNDRVCDPVLCVLSQSIAREINPLFPVLQRRIGFPGMA